MKKIGWLRLLGEWFTTVKTAVFTAGWLLVVFSGLHLLGQGTMHELQYALLLAGIGLGFAALVSFIRYVRRACLLSSALSHLPPDEAGLPDAITTPEEGFRTLANAYRQARNQDAASAAQAERDRLDYFTLWVHQIKTPISALDLMAQSDEPVDRELLRQETFKIGQYVDAALAYQRLQSLSNDLLLCDVPLYPLCCSTVKKLRPIFLYRKISLFMEPFGGAALSDAKWLEMALTQVLTNALKYTPPGGRITIALREPLVLTVSDTGIGIPAEDLPRVFDRGFTGGVGRAQRSGEQSTGIGLYLCKQACGKLGHTVSIASEPGQGTTVTFDLRRESYESYS
ncbi:MAG: sensor histidine kinase [Eubacteriales bacterium]|nr:sensor histidine kinase [Eubacteriales bacterium]